MHKFPTLRNMVVFTAITLSAGMSVPAYSEEQTFHIGKPLMLLPGSDATFESLNPGRKILTRPISVARSVRLSEDVKFTGESGTYSLNEGAILSGVLDFGAWQADDIPPGVLFSSPSSAPEKPEEESDERNKTTVEVTSKLRFELLNKMVKSMRFAEIDLSSFSDTDWLFCGEGQFVNKEGDDQNVDICIGDADGDGFFDRAAMITFQANSGLGVHEATAIEGAQFQAGFEASSLQGTGYKWVVMPYRDKKDYSLRFGYTLQDAKQLNASKTGYFHALTKNFEGDALKHELFGDLFDIKMAKKKKRVDVSVVASRQAATVIMPYDLKMPANEN